VTGISAVGLGKRFGAVQALSGVDVAVGAGEIVAVLGQNGGGKSTLLRILGTTVIPDEGRALVGGHDVVTDALAARRALGLMVGDERALYWRLTGRGNLAFFATLHGLRGRRGREHVDELLEQVALADVADRRATGYSSGMRMRLMLARALIGNPRVLLLDEPARSRGGGGVPGAADADRERARHRGPVRDAQRPRGGRDRRSRGRPAPGPDRDAAGLADRGRARGRADRGRDDMSRSAAALAPVTHRAAIVAAFLRRDWRIAISYRAGFALELITVTLTLTIFFFVGKLVDRADVVKAPALDDGYFAYVVFGLALLRVMQVGITSFSEKLREEQTTGTLEVLLAAPISPAIAVLASAVYDLARELVVALVMLTLAVTLFGVSFAVDLASGIAAFIALIGCLTLFCAVGVLIAAFTVVFKQSAPALGLVAMIFALLGGVYFPVEEFPEPLRFLSDLLPFTWCLDALRAALLEARVEAGLIGLLVGCVIVFLPASLFVFALAVRRARRTGTLAIY
jgi:ABC-type lipoprotein export system ATPase subunit/ABC-type polysaccharide/polyol phosphate export permease